MDIRLRREKLREYQRNLKACTPVSVRWRQATRPLTLTQNSISLNVYLIYVIFPASGQFIFTFPVCQELLLPARGLCLLARSARLRDGIHQRRLAALDDLDGAPNGRAQVFRVGNGPFSVNAQAFRDGRLVIVPKRNHHSTVGDRAFKDAVVAFLAG